MKKTEVKREKQWAFSSNAATRGVATLCRAKTRIPTVFYTIEVKALIDLIVAHCPKEVGWWGTVETLASGDYLISDIYVPEQFVTGTETDILPDAMMSMALGIIQEGKDPDTLYYWGHSHVNMGVTPSGQDEDQVETYLDDHAVFIRGIYNKSGNSKVDVYDRDRGLVFQCVPNHTPSPLSAELIDLWKKHLDLNVKNPPPVTVTYNTANNNGLSVVGNGNRTTGGYPGTVSPQTRVPTIAGGYVPISAVIGYDVDTKEYFFPGNQRVALKAVTKAEEIVLDDLIYAMADNTYGYDLE
jgi:hypothetical protein